LIFRVVFDPQIPYNTRMFTDNTIDYRSRFIEFYFNELREHPTFQVMSNLTEDSPWHRESNIGVHTDMVVAEFISRSPETWAQVDMVGAVAAAFHDFGKPQSMEELYREDRGNYKRFAGHEKVSARIFEDWAASNMAKMEYLGLEAKHIHMVAWLCEYHLPWALKKPEKRRALALTAMYIERECSALDPFYTLATREVVYSANILERLLLSDTWGRISDDAETKRQNALIWVAEFKQLKLQIQYEQRSGIDQKDGAPILYVAIGAPACGKSTFRRELSDDTLIHNMDELRVEWYCASREDGKITDEMYDFAFKCSTEDKQFASKVNHHFIQLIKTGQNVYSDNTNASQKRRRFCVIEARKHGYKVVAVLFPTPLQTLLDRQKTRTDKTIPGFAVKRIWDAISQPQIGEFDEILVIE